MLVFVVAKKTRLGLRISSGLELRAGLAIAGAEAQLLPSSSFGMAEAMP
jgi:hypothetical protein